MPGIVRNVVARAFKSAELPPALRERVLSRQKEGNIQRLEKLAKSLQPGEYHIELQAESELVKCFYPTKFARVELPNGKNYSNKQLEMLGENLLLLNMNKTFLNLFKRSEQDISGFDFNFAAKMDHMSSWKKDSPELIRRFLRNKKLTNLARLPAPSNRIPERIQHGFDRKAFSAVIGYISVTNELTIVSKFLREKITNPIARAILLR
ncbi:hypothetical protein HG536_0E01810 [Torulaspora globosa]|uniref:RNase III domain-containing protein n=1 Tax=Torulaspora globosa TaxID=48254 RepID=A0A7G3ZID4_9SACH|nr:uncharacterized protein HG536_0E01810 [Torulaspora globosa]QLL33270.1 hypothetical protein HG536_0E01810 [Torulaspora globosa]